MTPNRPEPVLDAWDDLTRNVEPPTPRGVRTNGTLTAVAPLLVGAIVIAAIAVVPNLLQGPAGAVGMTPPVGPGEPSPSATPDAELARQLVRIQGASMSDDRRTLRVEFVGGGPAGPYDRRNFDPESLCSVGYELTARPIGDELEVGLYSLRGTSPTVPAGLPIGCTAVGHLQSIEFGLGEPFTGTVVRDLAGQTLHLGPPGWLADIRGVPEGWLLREDGDVLGDYPRWSRTWSPVRNPDPLEDPFLELIQSHDGPVQVEGGPDRTTLEINGRRAELQVQEDYGMTGFREMVLLWTIDRDGFALVCLSRDFSREELIALAESISLPSTPAP